MTQLLFWRKSNRKQPITESNVDIVASNVSITADNARKFVQLHHTRYMKKRKKHSRWACSRRFN